MTEKTTAEMLSGYKKSVFIAALYMLICIVLRYIAMITMIPLTVSMINSGADASAVYIAQYGISALCLQILPAVIGLFVFKRFGENGIKSMYRKPNNLGRAVSNFPAVYGLGQIANILTIIGTFIIGGAAQVGHQYYTAVNTQSPNMASALFLFFVMTFIAPIFEEFIFRGLLLDALKPYGNGLAIFVTGIMFGLFHGNFQQCFFAAVIGIALGYIADVTGSLLPTTIIHIMINMISGIATLFFASPSIQEFVFGGKEEIPDGDMFVVALFGIFMVSVLIFVMVGFISAVIKIRKIKRYKVPKVCPEISNGKKTLMLLTSVPMIITIILLADVFFGFSDPLLEMLV